MQQTIKNVSIHQLIQDGYKYRMEQFINYFGAALLGLISSIVAYLKIKSERKDTAKEREADSQELHDKILRHDFEITNLKGEFAQQRNVNEDLNKQIVELSKAVACFSTAVDNLVKTVDELKDEVRDMRKK